MKSAKQQSLEQRGRFTVKPNYKFNRSITEKKKTTPFSDLVSSQNRKNQEQVMKKRKSASSDMKMHHESFECPKKVLKDGTRKQTQNLPTNGHKKFADILHDNKDFYRSIVMSIDQIIDRKFESKIQPKLKEIESKVEDRFKNFKSEFKIEVQNKIKAAEKRLEFYIRNIRLDLIRFSNSWDKDERPRMTQSNYLHNHLLSLKSPSTLSEDSELYTVNQSSLDDLQSKNLKSLQQKLSDRHQAQPSPSLTFITNPKIQDNQDKEHGLESDSNHPSGNLADHFESPLQRKKKPVFKNKRLQDMTTTPMIEEEESSEESSEESEMEQGVVELSWSQFVQETADKINAYDQKATQGDLKLSLKTEQQMNFCLKEDQQVQGRQDEWKVQLDDPEVDKLVLEDRVTTSECMGDEMKDSLNQEVLNKIQTVSSQFLEENTKQKHNLKRQKNKWSKYTQLTKW